MPLQTFRILYGNTAFESTLIERVTRPSFKIECIKLMMRTDFPASVFECSEAGDDGQSGPAHGVSTTRHN